MTNLDKDLQILLHIIKYCEKIKNIVPVFENDFKIFVDNKNYYYLDSCSFSIIQIGEIIGKLSDDFRNKYNYIPWQKIRGLRNVIVHNYGKIQFEMLWEILKNDIDELNNNCRKILESYDPDYQSKLEQELGF